ncbi:putative nuclease HARBI1 [Anastrepha obliqua]|uniref:putative nuclease HARBI1 n=1 Tax=Anastrepha obliqua TaxID=95512 RepID=UPI00240A9446|nr:putative nuclease HARBI1 [Anastrepha obliqua]
MRRETFQVNIVLTCLEVFNKTQPFWCTFRKGRLSFNLEQCLYITLWKLSNCGVTFRHLSDRFNVAKGCVDGTHVKIPKPKEDPISYYNRKGFYSINVQAICDNKFRFLDVFIGYPGSCHDANVWNNSPIYNSVVGGQIQLAQNAIILGDSAYPLSTFLLTPYRDNGHLTREQKKFNFCLSSTRVMIEQAFGILKNKFRILYSMDTASHKKISKIVFACTILHNFIINNGNPSEYISSNNNVIENDDFSSTTINELPTGEDEDGVTLRNNLTTLFSS